MKKFIILIFCVAIFGSLNAQERLASWTFNNINNSQTLDNQGDKLDDLIGFHDPVTGVVDKAICFDGFTSYMERDKFGLELPGSFTINVWVMLKAYPWFRCPVFDLRAGAKEGVILGVNRHGEITMGIGKPTTWKEISGNKLVLGEWMMLSLVVDHQKSAKIYVNGQLMVEMDNPPPLRSTRNLKLNVGRNKLIEEWWDYQYTVTDKYSYLDGAVDELVVYKGALENYQLEKFYNESLPIPVVELEKRVLPVGPEGPSEFGADYTNLSYTKEWDRLWRVGDLPDVLVRFADNNCRLVFWRGTSFVPCWVTENGIWYTNEWLETWGSDVEGCAEPLMDRECRFSHVRIIENTPARTIVHWRYGLVDTEYTFAAVDIDGRGEWCDEYYIIYPDGIGIRRMDLHYSNPLRKHDWEESIVLLSPGQHPDDVMQDPEITLGNMKGETHDYSWRNDLPVEMKLPEKANIHVVNFKSEYKPFYIIPPDPFESAEGKYESPFFRSYAAKMASYYRPDSVPSVYGWWNHWPVTPVPGDGRWVVNNDRASHFNLTTFTQWKDYYMDESVKTRIMLHGMTNQKTEELVPLAKSWLEPPRLETKNGKARYESAERAYIVDGLDGKSLVGELLVSKTSPAIKPAFILMNTKLVHPVVLVNGKELKSGKDYQTGIVKELDGWKTIIWIDKDFDTEVEIDIR